MSAMAELPQGAVVAGCRVEAVVGRGGMGVVYRATQLSLERPVALKAIAPELAGDATFRERFKRESRIAASIEHPNVIPVYEAGEGEGMLYLIMRYVEGTDLRALIDAEGGLSPERAARIVAQVAAALAAAHRRDLIHRDVKPANVLIDAGGERDHAYLTDFGIARHAAATSGLTRTGSVIGTLDYLAPERIQDQGGDGRADVYALGCVLFEALTGTLPFARDNDVAKMYAHLSAPVPSAREAAPEVPEELDALAQRAMAKNPDDRFTTATEMAEALMDTLPARPARARTEVPPVAPVPGQAEDAEAAASETAPAEAEAASPEAAPVEADTASAESASAETGVPLGYSEEVSLAAETAEELPPAERRAEPERAGAGETAAGRGTASPGAAPPAPGAAPPAPGAAPPAPGAAAHAPASAAATGPPLPARAPSAPSRRRGVVLALGGAALAAVVLVLVLALSGDDPQEGSSGSDGSPASGQTPGGGQGQDDASPEQAPLAFRLADSVTLDPGPDGLAAASGTVWVADKRNGRVVPVDEAGAAPQEPIPVGPNPDSVAVGFGSVWVTNTDSNTVSRIDPGSRTQTDTIDVGQGPEGIAVSDEAVWVANGQGGSVTRIEPEGGDGTAPVGAGPVQLAVTGDDRVWVTLAEANRVVELDGATGRRTGEAVRVPGQPRGIAFDGERLWVSATTGGYLAVFDPDGPGEPTRVEGIRGPREVRFGLGAIWVTTGSNERVIAIDPETRERIRGFDVGPLTYGLAVSDRFAWAASEDTGRLVKIAPRE
jgi:YVTN family beta-propeller protein